jgi:protein LSM12
VATTGATLRLSVANAPCVDLQVVEKAPVDAVLSLPHVSEEELLKMEQKNKGIAERALASIGKDVSAEAQAIFDALNKTMPCEWEGQNIRVMEEVLIKPPYQPQNCVSSNTQVLSRIKKVVRCTWAAGCWPLTRELTGDFSWT